MKSQMMRTKMTARSPREALLIDDDYSHIYWFDQVEGCWVAYRRTDCVGEEELPWQVLGYEA